MSKREKASVQSHEWAQHTSVCRTCHSPRSNIYRVPILCAPIPCARSFRHNRALSVSNTHDSHRLFPHLSVSPPILSLSLSDLSTVNAPHFCNLVVNRGEKPRQHHVLDLYVHTYIHTCMHAYIHTYIHIYIQCICISTIGFQEDTSQVVSLCIVSIARPVRAYGHGDL